MFTKSIKNWKCVCKAGKIVKAGSNYQCQDNKRNIILNIGGTKKTIKFSFNTKWKLKTPGQELFMNQLKSMKIFLWNIVINRMYFKRPLFLPKSFKNSQRIHGLITLMRIGATIIKKC
jgi:hypothetical protein